MKDTDWTDWHLTRQGWRYGGEDQETGYKREKVPPANCLMTVRTYSCIPTNPKKTMQNWSEILWRTDDLHSLETAQEKWGIMPWRAPPLSGSSAIEHAPLKYIRVMQLPELQREGKKLSHR
jgi:hypothetical protein